MSEGFLERMAESSRRRSGKAKEHLDEAGLRRRVERLPAPPALSFSAEGFDLIAEIKPRSPSEGRLPDAGFSRRARWPGSMRRRARRRCRC